VRHLRLVSIVITVAGALLVVAALGLRLDPLLALVGLLLLIAGLVKVVTVALWRNLGAGGPTEAPDR
jgi:energy-converting hydrogenase Eha subunit C